MTAPILVSGLVKEFAGTRAVAGVDLEVPAGTVLGLLGPNGAGKTTTVRILATLLRPDAGRAWVNGHEVTERPDLVREAIGLTGQYAALDANISGRENLYLIGRLLDLPRRRARERAAELLERFGLTGAADRLVRTYSGGMRRRVDLAASLVGDPAVLFLDEPTTGLDPRSRNGLWDAVRDLVRQGTTVLLTTQYMEEAEALADAVVVMDGGRIVASGTSVELRSRVGGKALRVRPGPPTPPAAVVAALTAAGLGPAAVEDDVVVLPVADDAQLSAALRALGEHGVSVAEIGSHMPSLDEVFLALTGATPGGAARPADPDRAPVATGPGVAG
ncbi:MAG TPA: ATP-binding cassette domain-containing protein [Pilimelia sp.]|nr:ATP-binding cassette domain-containing protein [Pilimelia sp.]